MPVPWEVSLLFERSVKNFGCMKLNPGVGPDSVRSTFGMFGSGRNFIKSNKDDGE